MKNKYIQELDNIKADSSFKQAMIEKMENQTKPKFELSPLFMKATLVCTCACLIFISIFTYKTYQDTQALKAQLATAIKQIEKLTDQLNQKDLDSFMQRNEERINDTNKIKYSNPLLAGGMGSGGDLFPGMQLNTFDTSDFIIINQTNQYKELPIGKRYKHTFTIKEKKDILNHFIEQYQIEDYKFYSSNTYLSILSKEYNIEIKNDLVTIAHKNNNQKIDIQSFVENNPILFKNEYDMENYYSTNEREYVVLYQKTEDEIMDLANAVDEISIEVKYNQNTVIQINYSNCCEDIYYPAISYQQALNQLQKGEFYYEEGMKDYTNINKIYCARLMYMFDMESESWLPYYQFYVGTKNLDLAEERGFIIDEDEYILTTYVPAISSEYINHKKDYEIDIIGGMAQ